MYKELVLFDAQESDTVVFDIPESFALRSDKKYQWLQKACCWVMRKLGANELGSKTTYTKIAFDSEDLFEVIWNQRNHILKMYNYEIDFILMGAQDFSELMRQPRVNQCMTFNITSDNLRKANGDREVMGMQVRVIPTMSGIVVVPRQR